MAFKKRVKVSVSVSPLLKRSDADADDLYTFLHDVKGPLGGTFNVDSGSGAFSGRDKWYYAPNIIVTTSSEKVIGHSTNDTSLYVGSSGNTDDYNEPVDSDCVFTDGEVINMNSDNMRFIYIKHTGTSDINGTLTTNSFAFNLSGSDGGNLQEASSFEMRPGEVFCARTPFDDCDNFVGQSVPEGVNGSADVVNGSSSVRITVLALIDNVSG